MYSCIAFKWKGELESEQQFASRKKIKLLHSCSNIRSVSWKISDSGNMLKKSSLSSISAMITVQHKSSHALQHLFYIPIYNRDKCRTFTHRIFLRHNTLFEHLQVLRLVQGSYESLLLSLIIAAVMLHFGNSSKEKGVNPLKWTDIIH